MIKTLILIGAGFASFATCYLLTKPKKITIVDESVEPITFNYYSGPVINELNTPTQIFINSGPGYFPKWKKLKYWQPTKRNPKRR